MAKIFQFGNKTKPTDLADLRSKLTDVLRRIDSGEVTGYGISLTSGGRPVDEIVAGEVDRDPDLAFASASRLMQRVR